ncbi:hypothetical protein CBL_08415 [Carabus blaptoides fortunei]
MGLLVYEDEEDPAVTEELGEESDMASQDEVEESKSDSESQQDGDELSSDEEESDADTEFYLARDKITKDRDIKHTDLIELKAFIGLLYLAGAYKSNRQLLEELCGKEGDGIEKFGLVMSIKRFKLLLRVLRFADRTTRNERKVFDRLAPIREVFDKFVENCQKSYCLAGPFCVSNKPTDVVMRLAKPIFGSGRNITEDNWFTDFNLVDELKTKQFSYVGTVRKNKRHLPYAFVDVKGRKIYSSLFGFNKGKVLTSYIPRKGKNVILVSSLHSDDAIDPGTACTEHKALAYGSLLCHAEYWGYQFSSDLLRNDISEFNVISQTDMKCVWAFKKQCVVENYNTLPLLETPCYNSVRSTTKAELEPQLVDKFREMF